MALKPLQNLVVSKSGLSKLRWIRHKDNRHNSFDENKVDRLSEAKLRWSRLEEPRYFNSGHVNLNGLLALEHFAFDPFRVDGAVGEGFGLKD